MDDRHAFFFKFVIKLLDIVESVDLFSELVGSFLQLFVLPCKVVNGLILLCQNLLVSF